MMVKINKSCVILSIFLVCVVLQQSFSVNAQDSLNNGRSHPEGFLNFILSPIRATLNQAKRLLGGHIETVNDGVDSIRLQTYKMFMRLYNKTYSPEEIPRRMELFFQRREQIEESVRSYREGRSTFEMRENEFLDWDDDEIKKLTGVSLPQPDQLSAEERGIGDENSYSFVDEEDGISVMASNSENSRFESYNFRNSDDANNDEQVEDDDDDDDSNMIVKQQSDRIPANKDWRQSGCVSTPINQLRCGACYAIATMSVVESMRCIKKVSSPILSPQQVVDCSTPRTGYANYGCDGGWPTRVLKYLQDVEYATRETCYPFVRKQNTCKFKQVKSTEGCSVRASVTDQKKIEYKLLRNERDILYHVAKTGPVVTVMKASDKFLYYSKGIFDDARCSRRRDDVDHAIVIVGYGTQNGQNYWLIKNSWGTTEWGQGGYGLYKRGTNACSIGHWGWVVTG